MKRSPLKPKSTWKRLSRRTPLNPKGKSEAAQAKDRIQDLLREVVILRDGGCWARHYPEMGPCGPYRQDGELVLQADHLNTRQRNISYADTRLVVCVCKNHHFHHHNNMRSVHPEVWERYVRNAKDFIGRKNAKLLDAVQSDRRSYNYQLSDWLKEIAGLENELRKLKGLRFNQSDT